MFIIVTDYKLSGINHYGRASFMEAFFIIILLLFLVTLFMPWVNHYRFSSLREEIGRLYEKVAVLEGKVKFLEAGKVSAKSAVAEKNEIKQHIKDNNAFDSSEKIEEWSEEEARDLVAAKELPEHAQAEVPPVLETDYTPRIKATFEQNIATKLPVWVGAISLICAAFFLVRYSIELGWLGPMVRVSLGGIFGCALLAAGQWIGRREHIANSVRMAQGLVGAGLVALYVSVYAAINLYGLLPPLLGFGSMTIITAMAVVLSLRHGQPIAVFGLLGGLLTPALVGSDDPNAIAMFTYLFLLFSGMFYVLAQRGWWRLAAVSLVGVFCWSSFWFSVGLASSDAITLVIFSMAITAVVLVVTGRRIAENTVQKSESRSIHALNFMAIAGGVLTIIWLSFEITLTLFDWSMLGLLSIAVMALACFQPDIYQKPLWVKLASSLILLFIWAQDAPLENAVAVMVGMSAIYVGGGAFIMRKVQDPRFWASIQAKAAISIYLIAYYVLDLPQSFTEAFSMFWGVLGLLLAGLAIYQVSNIHREYNLDQSIREQLLAIYVLVSSAFISLGLAIELPWSYVPLAFAGQIAATAWVYQITKIDFLKKIIIVLTFIFIGMNYGQILLFADLVLESLSGGGSSIARYAFDVPILKLGAPAALISFALWKILKIDRGDIEVINVLCGAAVMLVMATSYYLLRDLFHDGNSNIFSIPAGFIERGVITIFYAVIAIGSLHLVHRYDISFLKKWGSGIFHVAMLRFAYFDLFICNPYWSNSQFVGEMPLFNGITLTYGVGLLLVGWALYNRDMLILTSGKEKFYKAIGLALLFALTSLTVRQYFQGGYLEHGNIGSAELYSYSVIWLLTGLALLFVGITKSSKAARMMSLAFMIVAVLKVFLFDAAELEGLYRVFSFLGLGISLMGLSYFYTKFVFSNARLQEEV